MGVVFSPQGSLFAAVVGDDSVASKHSVELWDLNGNRHTSIKGHDRVIRSVAFFPDGKRVITGSWDKTARLWDLAGKQLRIFNHANVVNSVAVSPDSQTILTGTGQAGSRSLARPDQIPYSNQLTVNLWSIDGQRLQIYRGHTGYVLAVMFAPDGQTFVTSSGCRTVKNEGIDDNTIRIWRTKPLLADFLSQTYVLQPLSDEQIDQLGAFPIYGTHSNGGPGERP